MASSVGTPVVHMKKMGRSLKVPDIRLENQRPSAPVNKALYEINDFPKNCMKRPSRHSFWFLERWNHHCLLQSGTISNAFKSATVQEKNTPGFFRFYTIFTYFADQISNLRFFHMHGTHQSTFHESKGMDHPSTLIRRGVQWCKSLCLLWGHSFASFCHPQHGSSSCRYKPTFWSNLSLRAMSEGRVPRSDGSANVQAMRCGLLPGRRRGSHLQNAPWRHVTTLTDFYYLQGNHSLLCL